MRAISLFLYVSPSRHHRYDGRLGLCEWEGPEGGSGDHGVFPLPHCHVGGAANAQSPSPSRAGRSTQNGQPLAAGSILPVEERRER